MTVVGVKAADYLSLSFYYSWLSTFTNVTYELQDSSIWFLTCYIEFYIRLILYGRKCDTIMIHSFYIVLIDNIEHRRKLENAET